MPTTVRKSGSGYVIMRHGQVVGHSTSRKKAEASARIADKPKRHPKPRQH